ncbi:MAG: hypothetical protein RR293_06475 [Bacteroidales bacterium]
MLRIDAVRVAVLCAAYFIVDFENLYVRKGRYASDYEASIVGVDVVLTCECVLDAHSGLLCGFRFWIEAKERDVEVLLDGSVPTACNVAMGLVNEYLKTMNVCLCDV